MRIRSLTTSAPLPPSLRICRHFRIQAKAQTQAQVQAQARNQRQDQGQCKSKLSPENSQTRLNCCADWGRHQGTQ